MPNGTPTPWSYFFIRSVFVFSVSAILRGCRLLFKFVLKIFYGTIVVENAHVIPPRGKPWYVVVCAPKDAGD